MPQILVFLKMQSILAAHNATTLAFRLGQLDTVARCLLGAPTLYTPDMRAALALRWLTRIWALYREDRAILTGEALIGAECSAARNAFLDLLGSIHPPDILIADAIGLVRRIAIRPLAHERRETTEIVAASEPVLTAVLEALTSGRLPRDPVRRLEVLITQFRYSNAPNAAPLAATAQTPCWAINLAAAARSPAFYLTRTPLPVPGIVRRKMFRADRDRDARRRDITVSIDAALHDTTCDIAMIQRAALAFKRDFTRQRSHSRLATAWFLLFALDALSPAQLARALPASKAGAAKLLRQLVAAQMAHHHGTHEPYVCAIRFAVAFPAWESDAFAAQAMENTPFDPAHSTAEIEE